MTSHLFVKNLKLATADSVVNETVTNLLNPPGRRPDRTYETTANWYLRLSEEDQQHARNLAQLCADSVLFGVLAVLDGARAIEETDSKSVLELYFKNERDHLLLNNQQAEPLHDIFRQLSR